MEHEIFNSDEEEYIYKEKKERKTSINLFSLENIPYFLIFISIFFTMIAKLIAIASIIAGAVLNFLGFGIAFSAFILAIIAMLKKKKFDVKDGICLAVTMFGMLISVL